LKGWEYNRSHPLNDSRKKDKLHDGKLRQESSTLLSRKSSLDMIGATIWHNSGFPPEFTIVETGAGMTAFMPP